MLDELGLYHMRDSEADKSSLVQLVSKVHGLAGHQLCMVEIGSYAGESAEVFCKTGCISSITCIDPWMNGYDTSDEASYSNMQYAEYMFDMRASAHSQMHKFKGTLKSFAESGMLS